jgi:hypothetical protein
MGLVSGTFQAQQQGARELDAVSYNLGLSSEIQMRPPTLPEPNHQPLREESLVEGKRIPLYLFILCQVQLKTRTTYHLVMMEVQWATSISRSKIS